MNAPEFNQPIRGKKKLSVGDTVSFRDLNLEERVGKITDSSPGGTFDVVWNNITFYRRENELFPVSGGSSPSSETATPSDLLVSRDNAGTFATDSSPIGEPNKSAAPAGADGPKPPRPSNQSPTEMAAEQVQAAREDARQERGEAEAESGSSLDAVQTALDGVGLAGDAVVPGSGVAADGTNAIVSLIRAASDPKNAGKHLKNAAISTVSMVPFVGDLAKVFKYGPKATKAAKAVGKGGRAAESTGVSDQVREFLAGEDDSAEETQSGNNGAPPDGPGSPASDSDNSGSGDDGDPLTDRSANVKDKVFEFGSVVGKASAATIAAANSISLMNKAAIEYHRDLVKYNGEIAEAYGQLESERAHRSIRQGAELSDSLSGLVESHSNLEDKLQDFSSPWKVIGADIARILTDILAVGVMIVDFLEPISEIYVNHIRPLLVKWGLFKAGEKTPSSGWFDKIQADAAANSKKPRKV